MPRGGLFITAADPSADANAALLVRELRAMGPAIPIRGIGGPAMEGAGVELLADTTRNAAMGLRAVLRYFELRKLKASVRSAVTADPPAVWLCIDSWSLNVHFARLARSLGIPVLYYVAPQTWASREGRIRPMRQVIDRLACILPFEQPYFRRHGLPAEYVGHPLGDRLALPPAVPSPVATITILPGSRRGVTRANWPRLLEVARQIHAAMPTVRFKVPLTPNAAPIVLALPLPDYIEARPAEGYIDQALASSHLALCVSGTAALHVAAHGVPLIVVYYGSKLAWNLLGRWIIRTRTYSLVNLLAGGAETISQGDRIAPEFIPWNGPVEPVANLALSWLRDPAELARRREMVRQVVAPLARPGASARVAAIALEMLSKSGPPVAPPPATDQG